MSGAGACKADSVVIVGAGIFGASTALWLSRNRPSLRITLLDQTPHPCPRGASYDINKIIRSAYADIEYCRLAARCQDVWRKDPLYRDFYHERGMLSIHPYKGGATEILQNFKLLGINPDATLLTPEDVRQRFNGVFKEANFGNAQELLWDPHAGWAEAAEALDATITAAVDNGVTYKASTVSKLILRDGVCEGVTSEHGQAFLADQTLLSTGADTARLLAESAPDQSGLHVGRRFVAGAITVAKVKLTAEQLEVYKDTPAVLWDADPAHGEAMPPTPEGYLKFIRDIPLANTVEHRASKTKMSITPAAKELTQWTSPDTIPTTLQEEIETVISGIFGPTAEKELKPDQLRLCWDALAPDENWFITPHPRCPGLSIATAGTGHAWKFLPVIGEHVGRMMTDPVAWKKDEEALADLWAWDRKIEDSPDEDVIPQRDLADVIDGEPCRNHL